MAKKIYTCGGSQPSININLPNGNSFHVAFMPHTNGGGVYVTDREDVQQGIEKHRKYGVLFKGKIVEEPVVAEVPISQPDTPDEAASDNEPTVVVVGSMEEAKEYIAVTFSISRSKLRSPQSIIKYAEANNVVFKGCDMLYQ